MANTYNSRDVYPGCFYHAYEGFVRKMIFKD